MFPEIVRDDIFRLETRRLWLRWATTADADAPGVAFAAKRDDATLSPQARPSHRSWGAADIPIWRAAMERGDALHLMLVLKGNEHEALGSVHIDAAESGRSALRYELDDAWRGVGLMTEAVQAAVNAAFMLGQMAEITASPAVLDSGGRRVLERCGFTYLGNGMRANRSGRGLVSCDHFRLERTIWSSLKGWVLPGLTRGVPPSSMLTRLAPARCVPA